MRFVVVFILFSIGLKGYCQFTDIAFSKGIAHSHIAPNSIGGGVGILDVNNDGFEDIYLTGGSINDKLFLNLGSRFEDITITSGILSITRSVTTTAVTVGDLNNDGYDDIFLCTTQSTPNQLLINNGDNSFTNATSSTVLQQDLKWSTGAVLLDINNDSFLDIYVVNYIKEPGAILNDQNEIVGFNHKCYRNDLYINDGDSGFTTASQEYTVDDPGCALAAAAFDFDEDGFVDLMVGNDFGEWVSPNRLFLNDEGKIMNESASAYNLDDSLYCMGIGIGDINNDLANDFYLTNIGKNALRTSTPVGTYADEALDRKVDASNSGGLLSAGWAAIIEDFDGDLDNDLFLVNGYIPSADFIENNKQDPNQLFMYDAVNEIFEPIHDVEINNNSVGRGAAYCDLNNDGMIDLVTINSERIRYEEESNVQVLINEYESNKSWVGLILEGTSSNADAIGAIVTVRTDRAVYKKVIYSGGTYASSNSKRLLFRFEEGDSIRSLKIQWPAGSLQEIEPGPEHYNNYLRLLQGSDTPEKLVCDEASAWGCAEVLLDLADNLEYYQDSMLQGSIESRFYDLNGKLVQKVVRQADLNLDLLKEGIYIMEITDVVGKKRYRKIQIVK